ncbi:MAG: hypothetical protein KF734_18685 [Saprospiraceae bacterium]|nr:hypothetical protein [Saprospiraceae bacterium]
MRSILMLFLFFCGGTFYAQQHTPRLGSSNAAVPRPPANLNASDGVYDKFVLIRWEPVGKTSEYRLFRATSPAGASLTELTKSSQSSTWFCDYSAEKGKDYFYAVMGSDGKNYSALSAFDKGFLRKDDKVAQDESLTAIEHERYAAPKVVFVLVENVRTNVGEYAPGDTAHLSISLHNVFDEPAHRTELRIYLSEDATWDFNDRLLLNKTYSGFPANAKAVLEEMTLLPTPLLPGEYFLLVVLAPEGDILNAKTGSTIINISDR